MTDPAETPEPTDPTGTAETPGPAATPGASEQSAAWSDVGTRFSALGQKLRTHFEQARHDEPTPPPTEAAATEGDSAAPPRDDALQAALRKLGDAIDGVVDAVGAAVKDPAVKADVKEVGSTLSAALAKSFAEVSEDLRNAFNRSRPGGGTPASPPRPGDGADAPDGPTG